MATGSRVQVRPAGPTIGLGGEECWTIFDETAAKVLGFSANTYVGMTSDADRYASLA